MLYSWTVEFDFSKTKLRNYNKRRTQSYDKKILELALLLVREKNNHVSKARDRYGIPEQTIRDHIKRGEKKTNRLLFVDIETNMSKVLMKLAEAGHLHSWTNVRERVFGILRSNNSVVPEKWRNAKKVTWNWLYSFRKRHQLKFQFETKKILMRQYVQHLKQLR